MRELLATSLELVVYVVGTAVLAAAGVFAELTSLSYLNAGNQMFAGWLALMGAVALYAAFSVGTEKLLPHLRETVA